MRVLLTIWFCLGTAACMQHPECDCLVRDPELILQVEDAGTHAPVAQPMFSIDGEPAQATCSDGSATCTSWQIVLFSVGAHTATIVAPGYATQTIMFSVPQATPTDCCPIVHDVMTTVEMSP